MLIEPFYCTILTTAVSVQKSYTYNKTNRKLWQKNREIGKLGTENNQAMAWKTCFQNLKEFGEFIKKGQKDPKNHYVVINSQFVDPALKKAWILTEEELAKWRINNEGKDPDITAISRSQKYFTNRDGAQGVLPLDLDYFNESQDVLIEYLFKHLPFLRGKELLIRASSSNRICTVSGEVLTSYKHRAYLRVDNAADKESIVTLFNYILNAAPDNKKYRVQKKNSKAFTDVIDKSMAQPQGMDIVEAPLLGPGLIAEESKLLFFEGRPLSISDIPKPDVPLPEPVKLKRGRKPSSSIEKYCPVAEQIGDVSFLKPATKIYMKDGRNTTVKKILENPADFMYKACAFPLDPSYHNGDRTNSFITRHSIYGIVIEAKAHGGQFFALQKTAPREKEVYDEESELPLSEISPGIRARTRKTIRDPKSNPLLIVAPAGTGKTHAIIAAALDQASADVKDREVIVICTPTHKVGEEIWEAMQKEMSNRRMFIEVEKYYGRDANIPQRLMKTERDTPFCQILDVPERADGKIKRRNSGLASSSMCYKREKTPHYDKEGNLKGYITEKKTCQHFEKCPYQAQLAKTRGARIIISTQEILYSKHALKGLNITTFYIDEDPSAKIAIAHQYNNKDYDHSGGLLTAKRNELLNLAYMPDKEREKEGLNLQACAEQTYELTKKYLEMQKAFSAPNMSMTAIHEALAAFNAKNKIPNDIKGIYYLAKALKNGEKYIRMDWSERDPTRKEIMISSSGAIELKGADAIIFSATPHVAALKILFHGLETANFIPTDGNSLYHLSLSRSELAPRTINNSPEVYNKFIKEMHGEMEKRFNSCCVIGPKSLARNAESPIAEEDSIVHLGQSGSNAYQGFDSAILISRLRLSEEDAAKRACFKLLQDPKYDGSPFVLPKEPIYRETQKRAFNMSIRKVESVKYTHPLCEKEAFDFCYRTEIQALERLRSLRGVDGRVVLHIGLPYFEELEYSAAMTEGSADLLRASINNELPQKFNAIMNKMTRGFMS